LQAGGQEFDSPRLHSYPAALVIALKLDARPHNLRSRSSILLGSTPFMLDPVRFGKPVACQRLEWSSNTLSEPITMPGTSIVIVEGIMALHRILAGHGDLAVGVETDAMIALEGGRARDAGSENAQRWALWSNNDALYRAEHKLHDHADLIVHGT